MFVDILSGRNCGGFFLSKLCLAATHLSDPIAPPKLLVPGDDGSATLAWWRSRFLGARNGCTAGLGAPTLSRKKAKIILMAKLKTVGVSYGALRKECLEAVRHWPGCETVGGIQIIRDNGPAGFSVRVTLYGEADVKDARIGRADSVDLFDNFTALGF
jgi:hypothetical protein